MILMIGKLFWSTIIYLKICTNTHGRLANRIEILAISLDCLALANKKNNSTIHRIDCKKVSLCLTKVEFVQTSKTS